MKRVVFAKIRSEDAGPTIRRLMAGGFVDIHAKIGRDGSYRYVPILPERLGEEPVSSMELVEGDAHTLDRRPPQERLGDMLGPKLSRVVPSRWETVGDVVILRLGPECWPHRREIGRAYAEVLGAKSVCADVRGVSGEFRKPSMEVIYGSDTESVRLENGIRYRFDVTKVMFSSGNTDERMRMRKLDCSGETVLDMFAGIGYFTLPLAKFSGARRVFACEKNPESYAFLVRNIKDNGLADIVIPILGDNRDLPGKAFADRILMGYVQTTSEFLPAALRMLKPGGTIHYHDTFYVNERDRRMKEIFDEACGKDGYEVLSVREVKSFAPSVSHYVADVRVRPSRPSCSR